MADYVFRFPLGQRLLHGLLMVSFLGLVATGMPLFFSRAGWAIWLAHALGGFGVMGFFHRVNAILLTACFLIHLAQVGHGVLIRRQAGILWGPDSLVPRGKDVVDLVQHFRWFVGLGAKPRFDRFAYWEKFDYWAVFWGMLVIGTSGYLLWFPSFFARVLPGWVFNVALLVHGEEALLAAGFIFTIHFFNSHLRPEKFPMDLVIFTGRVREDELREERPEEHARLVAGGRLASTLADPPALWLRNFGRIVGGTAVAIGLTLFALILVAVARR